MGTLKSKDKVVGSAKEKIGEPINKEELKDEGRTQAEIAKGKMKKSIKPE